MLLIQDLLESNGAISSNSAKKDRVWVTYISHIETDTQDTKEISAKYSLLLKKLFEQPGIPDTNG